MRRFFDQSIGRKLAVSFAALLVFLLAVGIIGIAGILSIQDNVQNNLDVNFRLNDTALSAWLELLEARRNEDNYQLEYINLGFETARTEYVDPAILHINNLRDQITTLITIETRKGHLDDIAAQENLLVLVDTYQASFLGLVDLYEQRGIVDEGVIGAFRDAVHVLEDRIESAGNLELQLLLLQMRRNEKDYIMRGDNQYIDNVRTLAAQLRSGIAALELGVTQTREMQRLADTYLENFESLVSIDGQIVQQIEAYRSASEAVEEPMAEIAAEGQEGVIAAQEAIYSTMNSALMAVIVVIIAAIAIGLALSAIITRAITRPLGQITQAAEKVAAGDLKQNVAVTSKDEIGRLAEVFNLMVESLRKTMASQVAKDYIETVINQYRAFVGRVADGDLTARLDMSANGHEVVNDDLIQLAVNLDSMVERLSEMARQIREAVTGMSSAVAEIQASTTQQLASANEQNAAVTQTVATVEEVRATVQQTAERAQGVAETSRQSTNVSRQGQDAVSDTVEGMKLIRRRVEDIAETILMLSGKTQQIGEIIDTVNALADQSKLLALNASIEAARAGEEGKGFAVVAMEVRQLAEQSRAATARVRDILSEIQQATNTAVMVTEEGSKGAEAGMGLVERAGDSIRDLARTIEEASQAAMQIAASTHQQSNGMDQLSSAMLQIRQATTQTAAGTQQTERSAQDLMQMARQLEQAASRYKLN